MHVQMIGHKKRDNVESFFVRCACGEEIIEFVKDESEELDLYINTHCWYNRKVGMSSGFTFNGFSGLETFTTYLSSFVHDDAVPGQSTQIPDKTNDKKHQYYLDLDTDEYFFIFGLYNMGRKKGSNCVWEVIIDKRNAEELLEELSRWMPMKKD